MSVSDKESTSYHLAAYERPRPPSMCAFVCACVCMCVCVCARETDRESTSYHLAAHERP